MTTASVTTTYAEYSLPGAFLAEPSAVPVPDRDPRRAARGAPPHAYAFRFHDVVTGVIGDTPVRSEPVRVSGLYYIDAEVLTAVTVAALPGDHEILLDNMRGNGWTRVVRCRTGNFQPFGDGDAVVSSQG